MPNIRSGRLGSLFLVVATYLFLYIPLIVLTIFSFNKDQFPAPWSGFSLRWYYELFDSTYLWEAFTTSLIVAVSATFLSIAMGIMLLYACIQSSRTRRVMHLFYLNLVIPEVVLAVGLLGLFSFLKIELGIATLIIAHTVLGLGYVVPVVYQKFSSLEPQLIEASLDLGATLDQTFFYIILPLLRSSLFAASLLVFVISFDDFIISYFCSGSSAQTLSLYIESMLKIGISPVINALSTLLLAVSSMLVFLFCYYNARSKIL